MDTPIIPTWLKALVGISVAIGSAVWVLRNIDTNNALILKSQESITQALGTHAKQTEDLLKVICINGVDVAGKAGRDRHQNCLSPANPIISWPGEPQELQRPTPPARGSRGSGLPPGRMFDD